VCVARKTLCGRFLCNGIAFLNPKVVSGAPEQDVNHAEKVCDMALDMIEAITDLKDPSTNQHLKIRVGVHSGAVVAGIVGLKMPRYCYDYAICSQLAARN